MLLALRLFALAVAGLQLLVAAHIARRPAGPFRWGLAALLALNGLAALRLAVLGGAPSQLDRLFLLMDGATGPMLLACGALALRFPDHDRRDRLGYAILGGGALWAAVLVVLGGASRWSFDHLLLPAFDWLHTTPATFGLAIAGVALARALAKAHADRAREAGLVALGFLPTMAENTAWAVDHLGVVSSAGWAVEAALVGRVAGQVTLVAAAAVVAAILLWPGGRNRGWRRALALVCLASGIAYFALWDASTADPARAFAVYLGTTTSFYILRPLGVGLAFSRSRTLWSLFDVACLVLVMALGKAFSVLVLGTPVDDVRPGDLLGFSLALLVLPALLVPPRLWLRVKPDGLDRPASDELLGRFLVDHYRRAGPDAPASKQEIEAATGIAENNLAAAVRRLERRIDPAAAPGTFVAETVVGVRGRKRYRLTAEGLRRLGPRLRPPT